MTKNKEGQELLTGAEAKEKPTKLSPEKAFKMDVGYVTQELDEIRDQSEAMRAMLDHIEDPQSRKQMEAELAVLDKRRQEKSKEFVTIKREYEALLERERVATELADTTAKPMPDNIHKKKINTILNEVFWKHTDGFAKEYDALNKALAENCTPENLEKMRDHIGKLAQKRSEMIKLAQATIDKFQEQLKTIKDSLGGRYRPNADQEKQIRRIHDLTWALSNTVNSLTKGIYSAREDTRLLTVMNHQVSGKLREDTALQEPFNQIGEVGLAGREELDAMLNFDRFLATTEDPSNVRDEPNQVEQNNANALFNFNGRFNTAYHNGLELYQTVDAEGSNYLTELKISTEQRRQTNENNPRLNYNLSTKLIKELETTARIAGNKWPRIQERT